MPPLVVGCFDQLTGSSSKMYLYPHCPVILSPTMLDTLTQRRSIFANLRVRGPC